MALFSFRRRCRLFAMLVVVAQSCCAMASSTSSFKDAEQAGEALLNLGERASRALAAHQRRESRHYHLELAVMGVLGGLLEHYLPAMGDYVGAFQDRSVAYAPFVFWPDQGRFWVSFAPRPVGQSARQEEALRAAIVRVGSQRGLYAAKAAAFAPAAALKAAEGLADASQRSRVLATVFASAAIHAPGTGESAVKALVQALRQSKDVRQSLTTVGTILPACEGPGPTHPAVLACLDYTKELLSDAVLQRASPEAREAAKGYAYYRPEEAPRLASRLGNPKDRADVLLSASKGAFERSDIGGGDTLLDAARHEAAATANLQERVDALASVAACAATQGRGRELLAEALAAARTARSPDGVRQLAGKICLRLAETDLHLARFLLDADDKRLQDPWFAGALAFAALRCRVGDDHAFLVRDLPRIPELAWAFLELAAVLTRAEAPLLRRAGEDAANAAVELAPATGAGQRILLDALSALAYVNSEEARLRLQEVTVWRFHRGRIAKVKERGIIGLCQIRVARVIAETVDSTADDIVRAARANSAVELLREGLASAASPQSIRFDGDILVEVGPAMAALYRIAPAEALAAAERAPAGPLRAEALLACGLVQALDAAPAAKDTLIRALAAVREVSDKETREVLAARASAALGLADPDHAKQEIGALNIGWTRTAAYAMLAALQRARGAPGWLESLAAAADAAPRTSAPERRAVSVGWIFEAAAVRPEAFLQTLGSAGLPWLVPP